jgi:hypothetical protein
VDLSSADLDAARSAVREAALSAAREQAARLLLDWLAITHISPEQAAVALARQDTNDPRYRQLAGSEKLWALAVAKITESAVRPGPASPDATAVADARERGVTWVALADVFGISPQSVQGRYRGGASRGGRRGPSRKAENS